LAAGVAAALAPGAGAGSIADGLYQLHNHPDGSQLPPPYGLRLDELLNVTLQHDVFTFDFDHAQSGLYMDISAGTVHIYGTVFGGHDIGSSYSSTHSGLWEIDFTYNSVAAVSGDDDLWVTAGSPTSSGAIRFVGGNPDALIGISTTIGLEDYPGPFPFSFRLGDEDDDQGHRGFAGISGWGWLNHGGNSHIPQGDWIFTAELIPLPPAAWMGLAGVLSVAGAGRLRRRRTA
jgi:hypothetical protein